MSEIKTPAEAARELLYKKKSVYERRDEAAIEAAYGKVNSVKFGNAYYRHDIGQKALLAKRG